MGILGSLIWGFDTHGCLDASKAADGNWQRSLEFATSTIIIIPSLQAGVVSQGDSFLCMLRSWPMNGYGAWSSDLGPSPTLTLLMLFALSSPPGRRNNFNTVEIRLNAKKNKCSRIAIVAVACWPMIDTGPLSHFSFGEFCLPAAESYGTSVSKRHDRIGNDDDGQLHPKQH